MNTTKTFPVRNSSTEYHCSGLSALNELLETDPVDVHAVYTAMNPGLWKEWLWMTDPASDLQGSCLSNRMHLLGLLVARISHVFYAYNVRCGHVPADQNALRRSVSNYVRDARAPVHSCAIGEMTLRVLNDTVSNIQLLWKELVEHEDVSSLMDLCLVLMQRFGELAMRPYTSDILDDVNLVEAYHDDIRRSICGKLENGVSSGLSANYDTGCDAAAKEGRGSQVTVRTAHGSLRILNLACIRNFTAFFFVAFRHLTLAKNAIMLLPSELLDEESGEINFSFERDFILSLSNVYMCKTVFENHLISASLDEFYALSMYYDLPIAAVQQYRQNFQGMYHSVSQVVYFQNPQYVRRKQLSLDLIQAGVEPISSLPLFQQLYSNVELVREDGMLPKHFHPPGCNENLFVAEHVSGSSQDSLVSPSCLCKDEDKGMIPTDKKEESAWLWFVVPGRIYLMCENGQVFYSPLIGTLFDLITQNTGTTLPRSFVIVSRPSTDESRDMLFYQFHS